MAEQLGWRPFLLPQGQPVAPSDDEKFVRLYGSAGDIHGILQPTYGTIIMGFMLGQMRSAELFACHLDGFGADGLKVVGALAIKRKGLRELFLDALAVDPSVRSRGIGGSALRFAAMLAQQSGLSKVTGEATPNPRTVSFYKEHGFFVGKQDGYSVPIEGTVEDILKNTDKN